VGPADFTEYNQGVRGGKIKVRAKIDIIDKKTLAIKEIPFSTTTTSLMESIVKASEKGPDQSQTSDRQHGKGCGDSDPATARSVT
jgi:DNA gyrase/topoisomerase IV subunit A